MDELEREVARGLADALLLVLVDDVVAAGRALAARLAEDDVRAGELLQLDRDVLEHVTEPGAVVLVEPAHEAALGPERAGVRVEARKRREQAVVEAGDLRARPRLERAEVDGETHHREVRVEAGTAVDASLEEFHQGARSGSWGDAFDAGAGGDQRAPGSARRVSRSNVPPSMSTWRRTFVMQTGLPSFVSAIEECESSEASTIVIAPVPTTVSLRRRDR